VEEIKDARGLLCPEPLLITKQEMERLGSGTFKVLVDTAAARDNITRLAKKQNWKIEVSEKEGEFLLVLTK